MLREIRNVSARRRGMTSRDTVRALDVLEPVVIQHSRDKDRAALERLAALDGRKLAEGAYLVVEVDGELVAAAPLDLDDEPFGDPFRPTAALRELLRLRARQIRQSRGAVSVEKARPRLREAA